MNILPLSPLNPLVGTSAAPSLDAMTGASGPDDASKSMQGAMFDALMNSGLDDENDDDQDDDSN